MAPLSKLHKNSTPVGAELHSEVKFQSYIYKHTHHTHQRARYTLSIVHSHNRIMKTFAFAKPNNFCVFTKGYS